MSRMGRKDVRLIKRRRNIALTSRRRKRKEKEVHGKEVMWDALSTLHTTMLLNLASRRGFHLMA